MGEVVRGWIVAFVGIFAWVILWDPLSKRLFEWVGPWLQSGILRRIEGHLANGHVHRRKAKPYLSVVVPFLWPAEAPNTSA